MKMKRCAKCQRRRPLKKLYRSVQNDLLWCKNEGGCSVAWLLNAQKQLKQLDGAFDWRFRRGAANSFLSPRSLLGVRHFRRGSVPGP